MSDTDHLSDEQLAELIATTDARLRALYAVKKARQRAAIGYVPREVRVARTRERNLEIRRLRREEKLGYKALADRFNLTPDTIKSVITQVDYFERMAAAEELRDRANSVARSETIDEFMLRRARETGTQP